MPTGIRKQNHQHRQNSGFTLIELLVSIGIIAILAGLLLAGIGAATSSVATAKAANEIATLETALAQFYAEYQVYPPSEIVLHENAADWNGTDGLTVRSRQILATIWPQFNFTIPHDFNGDGPMTDSFTLRGPECLVFFLGGMLRNGAPTGFSKNPTNPFDVNATNRVGPFHEFDPSRLRPSTSAEGMRVYVDTYNGQQTPILYLSSYEGRGYRTSEVTPFLSDGVYRKAAAANAPAWKDKTYQLISPGQDGLYGRGGHYDKANPSSLNPDDWDNLTNFSGGKLK